MNGAPLLIGSASLDAGQRAARSSARRHTARPSLKGGVDRIATTVGNWPEGDNGFPLAVAKLVSKP